MSIVLQGSTSGSITLQEPAVAGTTVLSLPATTGTVLTSASPASDLPSSINGPAFSAYQSSGQSFGAGTNTKVQLQTEEWDTANCFDNTTNYRFTPNVAGYYQVCGGIQNNAGASNWMEVTLYKNGVLYKNMYSSYPASTGSGAYGSCMVYLNGSTDYIEMYCKFSGASTGTTNINGIYFQSTMIRGA